MMLSTDFSAISSYVVVDVDEDIIEELEMGKQGVIFYIVEEAVNNARKHAAASNIWVRLKELEPGLALLEIQDDGIGFDAEKVIRETAFHKNSSSFIDDIDVHCKWVYH